MTSPSAEDSASPNRERSRPPTPTPRHQTKITEHFAMLGPRRPILQGAFAPNQTSRVTFLDLPQNIRDKIYDMADIGGNKFIDLNFWTIKNERWKDYNEEQLSWMPPEVENHRCDDGLPSPFSEEDFPATLLWAGSRVIHDEVQAKLYAQNTFAVSLLGLDGLRPLEMLSDAALQEIRALIVSLQPCKCLTPFCHQTDWGYGQCGVWPRRHSDYFWRALHGLVHHQKSHSRPLDCVKRSDKLTVSRWQRICERLASNLPPNQLRLYLRADLADRRTVNAILDPLSRLPLLKEAAINLGDRLKEPEVRALARESVYRLTIKRDQPPFRFMDLPVELQFQILRYTDLKARHAVYWSPAEQFWNSNNRDNCLADDDVSYRRDYYEREQFCSQEHKAAFGPHCTCLFSPLPYFTLSKAFGALARSVFYETNEFNLLPRLWTPWDKFADSEGEMNDKVYELTLSSFLRRMPVEYISHLRHLTVVFPPLTQQYLQPNQGGWKKWVGAINALAQMADLSRLKLEIHFADQHYPPYHMPDNQESLEYRFQQARRIRNPTLEKSMFVTYMRILAPLKKLGPRLHTLLIYVAWPLPRSAGEGRKANEIMLERMIMGEDYDSGTRGKLSRSSYSQPYRDY